MATFRRLHVPGGTYFFTVNLADRRGTLLTSYIGMLRAAFVETKSLRPFTIDAIVILPEHLHCIWTLPQGDTDFSGRWRSIKAGFSKRLHAETPVVSAPRGERGSLVWQPRFWEHVIRDPEDLARHLDYIHYNPVKHGHAVRPLDWPYSSFKRYVRWGVYPCSWGCNEDIHGEFGE